MNSPAPSSARAYRTKGQDRRKYIEMAVLKGSASARISACSIE